MNQQIAFEELIFPASWKVFTSSSCWNVSHKLTSFETQWLSKHEHAHAYREIFAVMKGICVFRVEDKILELQAGEMILLNPHERHTLGHLPNNEAIYWWCLLAPDLLNMLLWRRNKLDVVMNLDIGNFAKLMNQIWDDLMRPSTQMMAEYEFLNIASAMMCNFLRHNLITMHQQKDSYQDSIIKKILKYIDGMPVLNCPLSSVASLAGYSKTHFQRLFQQYTHKTFREYLLKKRIERYHELCRRTNISKKEIANVLGFSSTSALIHWKKKSGLR